MPFKGIPAALRESRPLELESSVGLAQSVWAIAADSSRSLHPVGEIAGLRSGGVSVEPHAMLLSLSRALSSFPDYAVSASTDFGMDALRLSAQWAVFRYLWAFADHAERVSLSRALDRVTGHQRSVISEQLSIGAAVYVAENVIVGDSKKRLAVLDVDALDQEPWLAERLPPLKIRPDYFIYDEHARDEIVVLEVKGTSGSRSTLIRQLSRGADQVLAVPDIVGMDMRRIVIGTTAARGRLRVYALEVTGPSEARVNARARLERHYREPEGGADDLVAAEPLHVVDPVRSLQLPESIDGDRLTDIAEAADGVRLARFAGRSVSGFRALPNLWSDLSLDQLSRFDSTVGPVRGTVTEFGHGEQRVAVLLAVEERVLEAQGGSLAARRRRRDLNSERIWPPYDGAPPSIATDISVGWNVSNHVQFATALASDGCLLALASS